MTESQLRVHEWAAVVALTCLTALLAVVSLRTSDPIPIASTRRPLHVSAEIEGRVRFPGTYAFPLGARVQDLLELAQPLSDANLKGVRRGTKLREGHYLEIGTLPTITVQVEGAVRQEGQVRVPVGTRLIDLLGVVSFSKNADLRALKKKRRLKDGETVFIPSRR